MKFQKYEISFLLYDGGNKFKRKIYVITWKVFEICKSYEFIRVNKTEQNNPFRRK